MKKYILKTKNKPHFQLLEIMIAIFLIIVCAVPALKTTINIYKEQAEVVRVNQRDHLVHLIHANLIEKFYKRMIPLDQMKMENEEVFRDQEIVEQLNRLNYAATYKIKMLRPQKEEIEQEKKYLVELMICITDKTQGKKKDSNTHYTYKVYIDRGARGSNPASRIAPVGKGLNG
jgi:hypothetical protein